jgi:hypothetical protein
MSDHGEWCMCPECDDGFLDKFKGLPIRTAVFPQRNPPDPMQEHVIRNLTAELDRAKELLESARGISDQRAARIQELEGKQSRLAQEVGGYMARTSQLKDLLRRARLYVFCHRRQCDLVECRDEICTCGRNKLLAEIDEVLK